MFAATILKTENRVQEGGGAGPPWPPRNDLRSLVRIYEKKVFCGYKSQIYFIWGQNGRHGERDGGGLKRSEWRGDGFAGLWGHSAYQEAPEVISWGSWRSFTPSLCSVKMDCNPLKYFCSHTKHFDHFARRDWGVESQSFAFLLFWNEEHEHGKKDYCDILNSVKLSFINL